MIYVLIPLSIILFAHWRLEKHENKQLINHIIFLQTLLKEEQNNEN